MCCPIITNNYKNFHRASQVIRKGWLSYTKYESNCFSKHFSLEVLEKFSCGIILPFFSPHLPEGISFIKQIKKMKFISESNVLVSAHPQSGNIWDEYINDQKLWTKRDNSIIGDIQFIEICDTFIGIESSLRSLALSYGKEYKVIDF